MEVEFEYLGGNVWQCVLFPSIAIDGYPGGIEIAYGWLFWVLRFKFKTKK